MSRNWIEHPTVLMGKTVELRPLETKHFEELLILSKDKDLWEFYPWNYSDTQTFLASYEDTIKERELGKAYPFVIYHKTSQKIIGSTLLFDISAVDRKLEIGRTWLIKEFWKIGINTECKLLLLTFCFETLQTVRVQLKATATNIRSRRAIEKIGGKLEGVIRKERLMPNGSFRNTAIYSILDDEWRDVKCRLDGLMTK